MGIYAKHVLPRFIDLAMRNKDTTRVRADWVPHAHGDVLEVGIGSGLNLPFYSAEVHRVYGVEPSAELQKMARKRMASQATKVEFLSQSAEDDLPLSDRSIDTVVMTWTLCSISDPTKALQQVKRVLRPSGASDLCRAWPRSRFQSCSLARPAYSHLEACRGVGAT
jgi:ubiquinone/menaquinone biosynthesis C-methylase UbiE